MNEIMQKIKRMRGYPYRVSGEGKIVEILDSDDFFMSLRISENRIDSISYSFVYDEYRNEAYFISFAPDTYKFMYNGEEWYDLHTEREEISDRITITIKGLTSLVEIIDRLLKELLLEDNKEYQGYKYEYKVLKQDILNVLEAFEFYVNNSPLNYDYMYYTMDHIMDLYSHKNDLGFYESASAHMAPIHSFYSFEEEEDFKGTPEERIDAIHKRLKKEENEYKPNFYNPKEYFQRYPKRPLNKKYVAFYSISNDFQMLLSILDYCCMHKLPLRKCKHCGKFFISSSQYRYYCSDECKRNGAIKSKIESDGRRKYRRTAVKRTSSSFRAKKSSFPIESLHMPDDVPKSTVKDLRRAILTGDTEAFSNGRAALFKFMDEKAEKGDITQEELKMWYEDFGRIR